MIRKTIAIFAVFFAVYTWAEEPKATLFFYGETDNKPAFKDRAPTTCSKVVSGFSKDLNAAFKKAFKGRLRSAEVEEFLDWMRVNAGPGTENFLRNIFTLQPGGMAGDWRVVITPSQLEELTAYDRDAVTFLASGISVPKSLVIKRVIADYPAESEKMTALAANPVLSKVERIGTISWDFKEHYCYSPFAILLNSPHLSQVKSISFGGWAWSEELLNPLSRAEFHQSLEELDLAGMALTSKALDQLKSYGPFEKVKHLNIRSNKITLEEALTYAEEYFPALETLDLSGYIRGPGQAKRMLESGLMARLTTLTVSRFDLKNDLQSPKVIVK